MSKKKILIKEVMHYFNLSKKQAKAKIKEGEFDMLSESQLYDYIAERLDMDSWSRTQEIYFDWDKYIGDMKKNAEIIHVPNWPEDQYLMVYC